MFRCLLTFATIALPLAAQTSQLGEWTPPSGEARKQPQVACASLRALTGYDFSIISAEMHSASSDTPAFCRILGQVQPDIRFEVALPASWNQRLLMIGNGGYAGEDLEQPGRVAARNDAVRMGFLFAQTNTGHDGQQEPQGTFAVNSQKLLDYAFRAVHVTAATAKAIAAQFYGAGPARSYFFGCSTGGRQALMSAQRHPEDFDGISAAAPVLDFTGTMVNYAHILQAFAAAPVTVAKLKLVGEHIYAACDSKDGVSDGIIEDPRRCAFDPLRQLPECHNGDAPGCFTSAQLRTLKTIYSPQIVGEKAVFPAWPPGAEAAAGNGRIGWEPWLLREGEPPLFQMFATSFFQYLAYPKKDPALQLKDFDVQRDLPRLTSIRKLLDATETDLSAFQRRGGKLLMTFGWADPALNPNRGIAYYESVLRQMGPATRDFFRLFMMPGVFHCSGGPGCDSVSRLTVLIDWTEHAKTPDSLVALKRQSGKVVRSRLLCPYPATAKYSGTGNSDDAASFGCVENATQIH